MSGKGDSDSSAYMIAITGGVVGGLLGSKTTVLLGAYLPVFIYQLGLDFPPDAAGLGDSQSEQGATRFIIATFASLVPFVCGVMVGAIVLGVTHGVVD